MLGRPRRSSTDGINPIGRIAPDRECNARGNGGGFAPLGALLRRVAGVSRLYWCNSPRLVAVRSRFGAERRPHRRPPRRQTPTTGRCGRGGLRCGHNVARWAPSALANCAPDAECPHLAARPPARRACGGIHAPTMKQPPSILIVPRQHTGKSLRNQQVVSFNQ